MRITDLLGDNGILVNVSVSTKEEVIDILVDLLYKKGALKDKKLFKQDILRREEQGSTALESGIASPHAKSENVKIPSIAALSLKKPVAFGRTGSEDTDLIFMIAVPENNDEYMPIASRLMTVLLNEEFRNLMKKAETPQEFINIINDAEISAFPEEYSDTEKNYDVKNNKGYRLLAVTACPMGIAHTFMAAESLKKTADKLSIPIKIETNGANWTKNTLNDEDIKIAEAVIIASDVAVNTDRFQGKRIKYCSTSQAIDNPEKIITEILLEGEISVKSYKDSLYNIYRHIMTGMSHMIPFVIAGGLFNALSIILDNWSVFPHNMGHSTAISFFFYSISAICFNLMLPVFSGYIAYSIGNKLGLMAGLVGSALITSDSVLSALKNYMPNTVSGGFISALLIGFVAGYISKALAKLALKMPDTIKPVINTMICPFLGVLAVSLIGFVVIPLSSVININISEFLQNLNSESRVLIGALLGGMMSTDMGGPINKAAYIFATGELTGGKFTYMASCLLGGMVPPIGTGISALIFKNKWKQELHKYSIVSIILGMCFVTEGVIPFLVASPICVIISCVAGSAVAGGLSMLFNCGLIIPQGGIFAFPFVTNIWGYVLAFFTGIVVTVLLLGVIKSRN